MKIVIDKRIPGLKDGIRHLLSDVRIEEFEGADIKRNHLEDADALFVRTRTRCDGSLLKGSAVKLIGTATIGIDHIDIPWCESHGIKVANAPGCNAPAVMQYVASSLSIAGFEPSIHKLGIIGKGHIGSLVADLYRKAGAKVLICDPPRKEKGLQDEDYLSLEELTERCDALTFHVPYTLTGSHPTHNLLHGPIPENIKFIVNSSRGPVIDHRLITTHAESIRFIIDTWPFEEHPESFDYDQKKSLIESAFISTPHIAGYSFEGKRRATQAMLDVLQGELLKTVEGKTSGEPMKAEYDLEHVISTFSPLSLSKELKESPEKFENLRSVHLRHEPLPSQILF